jgi:hypothetical protein
MWPGDFLINRTISLCGVRVRFGPRFAWVGFVYFAILLALCVTGVVYTQGQGASTDTTDDPVAALYSRLYLWFIAMSVIRCIDLVYSAYTGVARRIDPRRRKPFLIVSICLRVISAFGGLIASVAAVLFLADYGSPATPVVAAALYINLISLLILYALFLTPCGCCCLCVMYLCLQPRRERERLRQPGDHVRHRAAQDRVPSFSHASPAEAQQVTKKGNFGMFSSMLAADDIECPICLVEYTAEDQLDCLPCQHYFHSECMRVNASGCCPICRQPISREAQDLHKTAVTP